MLLPLVDKLVKKLATWKASLLSRGERLALVRHVLTAMPIHILLALALNPLILKKINRLIHDFLWHGNKDAHAGSCIVSWQKVCRPLELGGLAVCDLHRTGVALRTRWLWLHATDPERVWKHLHLPSDREASELFRASTAWTLGDSNTCKFWRDHWLQGQASPR